MASLTKSARKPLALHGDKWQPERGGGTEAQVVGFKEAPPFGRGASHPTFPKRNNPVIASGGKVFLVC
jgi:hypothetical protein